MKPIAFLTESISSSRSQASVHLSLIRLFIILPLKLSRSKEYSITTAAGVRLPPINGGVGWTLLTEIIVEGSMSSPDGSSTRFIVFVLCVVRRDGHTHRHGHLPSMRLRFKIMAAGDVSEFVDDVVAHELTRRVKHGHAVLVDEVGAFSIERVA